VADALGIAGTVERELAETEVSLQAAREYHRLTDLRYRGGVTSYLEVLDAERQVLSAELAVNAARTRGLTSAIALYRALGGGWSDQELQRLAARPMEARQ
jgi:multidrug efflux system outer membrane protein